jgi:hypothetical protein
MKNDHPLLVVVLGSAAFALAFVATGFSLPGFAANLVVIGAVLSAAAFASVTAMFSGWRASTLSSASFFSASAGALAYLLHFTDLSVPINLFLALGNLGPITRTAIHLVVPGVITGILAARSLVGWSHLSRSAAT